MSKLTIIRGLPGSGKTTRALKIIKRAEFMGLEAPEHFEADMYFEVGEEYKYILEDIKKAHNWCQASADYHLHVGHDVIVSNTFVELWQIEPYLKMEFDVLELIECNKVFNSIHDVPEAVIQSMSDSWQNLVCDGLTIKQGHKSMTISQLEHIISVLRASGNTKLAKTLLVDHARKELLWASISHEEERLAVIGRYRKVFHFFGWEDIEWQ